MEERSRRPLATVSHGVGAVQVHGRLGGTSVKGTRILGACLRGDAVGGEDERTRAENEVAWTTPGGVAGATEGVTTDVSARGAVGCEKRRCHEGEPSVWASASASVISHSSDRSGSDDRDDGGSDSNGPND